MTRFLIGVVVGALLVAGLQLRFAVIPATDRGAANASAPAPDIALPSDVLVPQPSTDAPSADLARRPGANSSGSGAQVAKALSDEDNASPESPDEPGPRFPIELPETHAGFVDKDVPSLPDEHAKVEAEDVDASWAELVEAEIFSFVSSHPSGSSIQLVSLVCRTTRCEIAGSVFGERGGETWNQVLSDMRKQPWFASNFADSMFGSGGGMPGEFRFVTIIARVGSEITGPVSQ